MREKEVKTVMKFSSSALLSIVLAVALVTLVFLIGIRASTGRTGDNVRSGYSTAAEREYDPWTDINDDGKIDIIDIATVARLFGTTGTPINKTALLQNLATEMAKSGLLLPLPFGATHWDGTTDTNTILLSLDLNQAEPGNQQSVFVYKGATITITGEFQNMDFPGTISQVFFIYSWTPSWPPPQGYYHELYNGAPGPYPGVRRSFSFSLTVPNKGGVYYLYLASGAHYSMEDAVNQYAQSLWVPYAVIVVSGE